MVRAHAKLSERIWFDSRYLLLVDNRSRRLYALEPFLVDFDAKNGHGKGRGHRK